MKMKRRKRKICSSLYEYEPREGLGRCNILVYGDSGSGKSSIICTTRSEGSDIPDESAPVRVGSAEYGNCTVTFDKYTFSEERNVSALDPWGNSEDRYNGSIFRTILKGGVKIGHKMENPIFDDGTQNHDLIVDCVIFTVAADEANNSKDPFVKLKEYYEIAKEENVCVIIAVTKIDKFLLTEDNYKILAERDIEYSLTAINQSDAWKKLRTKIKNSAGDSDATVLPIINYEHGDTYTNDVVELVCQKFVQKVIQKIDTETPVTPLINAIHAPRFFRDENPFLMRFLEEHFDKLKTVTQSTAVPPKFNILRSYYCLLQLGSKGIEDDYEDIWRFIHLEIRCNFGDITITVLYHPDRDDGKSAYFEYVSTPGSDDGLSCALMYESFGDPNRDGPQRSVQPYTFCSKNGDTVLAEYQNPLAQHVKIFLQRKRSVVLTKVSEEDWNRNHSWIIHFIRQKKMQDEQTRYLERRLQEKDDDVEKLKNDLEKMRDVVIEIQKKNEQLTEGQDQLKEEQKDLITFTETFGRKVLALESTIGFNVQGQPEQIQPQPQPQEFQSNYVQEEGEGGNVFFGDGM